MQLRTGMTRLNRYLYKIGVSEWDLYICRQARETVNNFLYDTLDRILNKLR